MFEEHEIWKVFLQILKGLKVLHELNIMHRDLKSANVFLNTDMTAKLGDLNVSKIARMGLNYTQTGTPYYARYGRARQRNQRRPAAQKCGDSNPTT